ncbi:CLUMA_CG017022, isoform A [Clunio marinus]|uniref:CLUMA_CG017022, isoform A n=1 Tax=Clunio marinus TaxID=568069 RepID=A0A1J1IUK5_9DIPT|nr:CLUMA_CG017022, isoform A [Clunio marinus]
MNNVYSKDSKTSLLEAFQKRDLGDFIYILEFSEANVNEEESSGISLFQKILMTPNSASYIKNSINNGADLYTKTADNRYPLHFAVFSLCPENLKAFLKRFDRSKINVKYNHKNSLHILIDLLTNDNYENVSECIKILLMNGCNPNLPNEKNQTPFFRLLKKQPKLFNQKELVEFFLDNSDIDLYTYRQDDMMSMFKTQNSHRKIPEQKIQNVDPKFMMSLVIQQREAEFESYFKAFKESCSNNAQNYSGECAKFLEMAAIKNAPNIVELLLEHETIDLSVRAEGATWKFPPSFVACMQGYYKIVEMFLKQPSLKFCFEKPKEFPLEKNTATTLIHEVCLRFGREATNDADVDFKKCFDLLINDDRCTPEVINSQDSYGCTPLHYSTRYKNDEATLMLLKKSAYICTPNNLGQRALNDINKDTFERFLDDSVVALNRRNKKTHMYVFGHDEQEININYSFLIPPKSLENREISPLQLITKNKDLRYLIKHPVLFSFLYIKWSKLSLLFYINFVMFSLFMLSLIVYIVLCQSIAPDERTKSAAYMFFYGLSAVSVFMLIIREILQCVFSVKHYFRSKMNWFEIILILLSILVLLNLFEENFQRILRGITILFAATEFLTLAGTLPNLSVSTHMVILKTVILTFLKSIALYSILLFGFALCFYTIFGNEGINQTTNTTKVLDLDEEKKQNNFYNPGIAIIKTLVMLTGELDFSDLELHEASNYIIFVLFVFLITIVLFNLLNALAVSDTQVIKSEGQLVDLMQRISVLNRYERIISNGNSLIARWLRGTINIFHFWIPTGKIVVFPDKDNEIKTARNLQKLSNDVGAEELQTLNNNASNAASSHYERIVVNNWLPSRFHRYATLDPKIMKAIKLVMESKAVRQKEEEQEIYRKKTDEKLLRDVISLKIQNNNLHDDISSIKKHLKI